MSRLKFDEENALDTMGKGGFDAVVQEQIVRRTRNAYIFALALIAIISGALHVVFSEAIARQTESATIVNVAGRQRMLSQRIALLADEATISASLALGLDANSDLKVAIDLFEKSHAVLIGAEQGFSITQAPSLAVRQFYFGETAVDRRSRAFVAAAREVLAAAQSGTVAMQALQHIRAEARGPLLRDLDAIVNQFEREARQRVDSMIAGQNFLLAILLVTLVAEALLIFRPLVERLKGYIAQVGELASIDPLTGLANRRQFLSTAAREITRLRQDDASLSILYIDIDHFKRINDEHSHAAGDAVLVAIANRMKSSLRASDLVARMGGEEFAVLLPRLTADRATIVAEKLRSAIRNEAVNLPSGATVPVTVSVGLATASGTGLDIDLLLKSADAALYRAKDAGRDRVFAG